VGLEQPTRKRARISAALVHCQKTPYGTFDGREPKDVTFVPYSVPGPERPGRLALLERLPYLALLLVGFTVPALLPRTRCALTAPFHPYRPPWLAPRQLRRSTLCCTFRGLAPPRRYLAPDPLEPGLSSTSVLPPWQRSPSQLFGAHDTSPRADVNLQVLIGCLSGPCRVLPGRRPRCESHPSTGRRWRPRDWAAAP
jgi:hypothetical protein